MKSREALASDEAFRAALLSAGRRERPDPRARRVAVAALTGASIVTTTSASAAVARLSQIVVKLATGTPFTTLVIKTAVVSTLLVAPATAPIDEDHGTSTVVEAPVLVDEARSAPPPRATAPEPVTPRETASPPAPSTQEAHGPAPRIDPLVPTRRPPAARTSTAADALLQEVERLEATRRAIDAGNLSGAARLLDRSSSSDALGPEAQVLAIELAIRQGRTNDARIAADVFLAAHGASPLAARVRRLIASP